MRRTTRNRDEINNFEQVKKAIITIETDFFRKKELILLQTGTGILLGEYILAVAHLFSWPVQFFPGSYLIVSEFEKFRNNRGGSGELGVPPLAPLDTKLSNGVRKTGSEPKANDR